MDQAIKERWVTALRSGEYEQGKGYLRLSDGKGKDHYCCLGVLSELAARDGVIAPATVRSFLGTEQAMTGEVVQMHYGVNPDTGAECETTLPPVVRDWAGLERLDPYVDAEDDDGFPRRTYLSQMNDNDTSFGEIADYIEEHF